ncbi:MAG: universal stress protein [Chloroflexi bacterium]|nr:universal stress protein [Chloroflexota bacterium]
MYKKIIVPLDGSSLAEAVLPHVEEIASHYDSEVILIRVVLPLYRTYTRELDMMSKDVMIAMHHQAVEYLKDKVDTLRAKGIKVCYKVLEGLIAESILDLVQTEKADLIAMSTHGLSGIRRWVYGSVADRVLQGAHCPVLLIRSIQA